MRMFVKITWEEAEVLMREATPHDQMQWPFESFHSVDEGRMYGSLEKRGLIMEWGDGFRTTQKGADALRVFVAKYLEGV